MSPQVLRPRILPPPRKPRTLPRPRVSAVLRQALGYRLTLLQAEAGYGKSIALAELTREVHPLAWYQVSREDNDPLIFLLHLCHSLRQAEPTLDELPLSLLENWDGAQGPLPWRGLVDQIVNTLSRAPQPLLLVLDDAHHVLEGGEIPHLLDRLIGLAPPQAHFLLAGRPVLDLPNLSRWRAQGEVLTLDQSLLTFTADEISALFAAHYGLELSAEEVQALLDYTEGWAIALQLIWQSARRTAVTPLTIPPAWPTDSLPALFDVLAHEVFAHQPEDVRRFLLLTSTLQDLHPQTCDALRAAAGEPARDSAAMLAYLQRQDLFVVETAGGHLRYHHIFHNFLRQQVSPEQRREWHRLAAQVYRQADDPENALYHLLEAEAWEQAAALLENYATHLLNVGRLDTLTAYLDRLPPETLHHHPGLIFTLGDLARLHSRFEEALGWYEQARQAWQRRGQQDGVARALRGQARVYLDTVNPSKAEELLEEALRLSDGFADRQAQVRLLELLAENKLNAGQIAEAERLRQRAEALRLEGPSNEQLLFRVLLRTGRLEEARHRLEARAREERRQPVLTPRAHRETLLLLSLIYAFMGEGEAAYQTALEGTRRGEELKSPYVTAVGYMRQGHALMLMGEGEARRQNFVQACTCFEKSVEISRTLEVRRLSVEANWGLCRAYGYRGDLSAAQAFAQEAIEIALQAGDEWIASLTRLALGASLTLAGRYEAAADWLGQALRGFQECSDPFGATAARLWQALGLERRGDDLQLERTLAAVLQTARSHGYGFLFTRPTLLGASDERIFVPLLIQARQRGLEAGYAERLLEELGLPGIQVHPGFRLRVQTLGDFRVWRGDEAIPPGGWRRTAARQLFQVLLTHPHALLDREQLCEFLWPGAEPAAAYRNFKIALNSLYQTLEPERRPGSESAFIRRKESAYGLRPEADLWVDALAFTRAARQGLAEGNKNLLERAVALYRGEYLPDALYETWAAEARERLATLFLEAADRLTECYLQEGAYPQAIELAQRILAQDNCWERAYRHLMTAYARLGDRGQVGRVYRRCVETLQAELEVPPAPETRELFARLTG